MPVQGLPCDTKLFAQITDLGFGLPHCRHRKTQLCRRHLERPATFPAARPRRGQPRERALGDQLALKLGECREDAEDQLTGGGRSVDGRAVACQHFQPDAAFGQVVHRVDQVTQVAPEAVQLPHNQRVTWPQRF